MSDAVIVGIISVIGSIIVQTIVSATKAKETNAQMSVHEQEQKDRLDHIDEKISHLERKIDIHNGYAEKFGEIQKDIAVIRSDLRNLERR